MILVCLVMREHMFNYDVFKMSQLTKKYVFKAGMYFKSLTKFKDARREWYVLNGTEIKLVKNDKERCRIVCKKECGFLAHYNKVAYNHTFKLKTLLMSTLLSNLLLCNPTML